MLGVDSQDLVIEGYDSKTSNVLECNSRVTKLKALDPGRRKSWKGPQFPEKAQRRILIKNWT